MSDGAAGGSAANGSGRGAPRARPSKRRAPLVAPEAKRTLFIGDLPPYVTSADLQARFTEYNVPCRARVMGSQCYGFVDFEAHADACTAMDAIKAEPLRVDGHALRVNWAQGSLPEWKRGAAPARERGPSQAAVEGAAKYEHPRVREVRLAAHAIAAAAMVEQLATGAAPAYMVMAGGQQPRYMLSYDDL